MGPFAETLMLLLHKHNADPTQDKHIQLRISYSTSACELDSDVLNILILLFSFMQNCDVVNILISLFAFMQNRFQVILVPQFHVPPGKK